MTLLISNWSTYHASHYFTPHEIDVESSHCLLRLSEHFLPGLDGVYDTRSEETWIEDRVINVSFLPPCVIGPSNVPAKIEPKFQSSISKNILRWPQAYRKRLERIQPILELVFSHS